MLWRCDLVPQYEAYREELQDAMANVLSSGRYTLADHVRQFEVEFSDYVGVRHGVGLNRGTDALVMALWCLGVTRGDQVITTPFTAIPTVSAIRHVGAEPVFVDIDPETYLLDIDLVLDAITAKTRAIVPVHLFGNAVDVEALRTAIGSDIPIIEDAAQAHGASVRGNLAGSLGAVSAFSFYPTKNLGGYGDGGMLLTDDDEIADKARRRRMYGMKNKDEIIEDGINSRLDELQAAILRVKLRHLDDMNRRRRDVDQLYRKLLPSQIKLQVVREDVSSVYHVYCGLCEADRDELVAYLGTRDIQTNVYYPMPIYQQPAYRNWAASYSLPVTEETCRRIIALPLYPEISEEAVRSVCYEISRFFDDNS
jgi:dTDP-4-amino-4,6-dideoxygalactose transaminase